MARRKESKHDLIASMPWPFGFVLGIVVYVVLQNIGGLFTMLAFMGLVACSAAAGVSFAKSHTGKRLLETQTIDVLQS